MRVQYAALPYRRTKRSGVEVLLVTSRDSGQWIVPKGRPEKSLEPHEVAAGEAMQEAGVVGRIAHAPVGKFRHVKDRGTAKAVSLDVMVFPMQVTRQRRDWPEKGQRQTVWLPLEEAAELATSKALGRIIKRLPAEPVR